MNSKNNSWFFPQKKIIDEVPTSTTLIPLKQWNNYFPIWQQTILFSKNHIMSKRLYTRLVMINFSNPFILEAFL